MRFALPLVTLLALLAPGHGARAAAGRVPVQVGAFTAPAELTALGQELSRALTAELGLPQVEGRPGEAAVAVQGQLAREGEDRLRLRATCRGQSVEVRGELERIDELVRELAGRLRPLLEAPERPGGDRGEEGLAGQAGGLAGKAAGQTGKAATPAEKAAAQTGKAATPAGKAAGQAGKAATPGEQAATAAGKDPAQAGKGPSAGGKAPSLGEKAPSSVERGPADREPGKGERPQGTPDRPPERPPSPPLVAEPAPDLRPAERPEPARPEEDLRVGVAIMAEPIGQMPPGLYGLGLSAQQVLVHHLAQRRVKAAAARIMGLVAGRDALSASLRVGARYTLMGRFEGLSVSGGGGDYGAMSLTGRLHLVLLYEGRLRLERTYGLPATPYTPPESAATVCARLLGPVLETIAADVAAKMN